MNPGGAQYRLTAQHTSYAMSAPDLVSAPARQLPVSTMPAAARYRRLLPGLLLTSAFALAAMQLGRLPWFQAHGLGALTIAIALGMLLGNTLYARFAAPTLPGVAFAKQRLLRLGIILFGLRLTFQEIGQVGLAGVLIDAAMLTSTFLLAWVAGSRLFGLERNTVVLIGAGSAICGAAAIMAAEPVIKARPEQVAVAIATVVVFGTLAMVLYPFLYQWAQAAGWTAFSAQTYGVYAGATIHEVAQVVVAGAAAGPDAANTAVIAKMVRVMMLAPFLVTLAWVLSRTVSRQGGAAACHADAASQAHGMSGDASRARATGTARTTAPGNAQTAAAMRPAIVRIAGMIPWFAIGFLVVVGIHSTGLVPRQAVSGLLVLDEWLLASAMFALGLTTHVSAIRQAGLRPLGLALLLAVWLIVGGMLATVGIQALAGNA